MPLINFRNVLSCSSEDRIHCGENLLKPEQYKKWLSSKGSDERITCILEFEKSSLISSVDIGNDGSAFIELFVSRSSSSKADDWTLLLPGTLLMTPSESRSNTNRNQVKLLKSSDLNKLCLDEKWDRLKIVCEQKFNRLNPFGLCFIKLYSPSLPSEEAKQLESSNKVSTITDDDDDETGQEQSKIGSFFAKKQAEKQMKTIEPTASNQIRTLSNVVEELLSRKSIDDKEIKVLLKKDVKDTPNRLSKRPISSDELEKSTNEKETKRKKTQDRSKIMKRVIFVLSGFQNPLRSELRNKATTMGAIYNDDWDESCTHLICAFPNTPKFTQVKKTRKGFIVNKHWILDCYKNNQLLSERDYEVKGSSNSNNNTSYKDTPQRTSERKTTKPMNFDDVSEDEDNHEHRLSKDLERKAPAKKKMATFDDDDDEEEPIVSKDVQRKPKIQTKMRTFDGNDDDDDHDENENEKRIISKSNARTITTSDDVDVYDAETDEDEPNMEEKPFDLTNCFHEKHFYVFNDDFDDNTHRDIRRIIYAYDGVLDKQITSDVKYIITNRVWNQEFEKISKANPEIKFLSLEWLQDCHDENKFVPCQPYLILP